MGHSVSKNLAKLLARNSISRRFGVHYNTALCVALSFSPTTDRL